MIRSLTILTASLALVASAQPAGAAAVASSEVFELNSFRGTPAPGFALTAPLGSTKGSVTGTTRGGATAPDELRFFLPELDDELTHNGSN